MFNLLHAEALAYPRIADSDDFATLKGSSAAKLHPSFLIILTAYRCKTKCILGVVYYPPRVLVELRFG